MKRIFYLFSGVFALLMSSCEVTMTDEEQAALDQFTASVVAEYRYNQLMENRVVPLMEYFTKYAENCVPRRLSDMELGFAFLGGRTDVLFYDYSAELRKYERWVDKCTDVFEEQIDDMCMDVAVNYNELVADGYFDGADFGSTPRQFDNDVKKSLCKTLFGTYDACPKIDDVLWEFKTAAMEYLYYLEVPHIIKAEWLEDDDWRVEFDRGEADYYVVTFYEDPNGQTRFKAVPYEIEMHYTY